MRLRGFRASITRSLNSALLIPHSSFLIPHRSSRQGVFHPIHADHIAVHPLGGGRGHEQEIAVVVLIRRMNALECFDPSEARIVEMDQDRRDVQTSQCFKFACCHTQGPIPEEPNRPHVRCSIVCSHHSRDCIAKTSKEPRRSIRTRTTKNCRRN